MMLQPSKEERELLVKLKKCTDQEEKTRLWKQYMELVKKHPVDSSSTFS